jgi:hypothetical protein
MTSGSPVWKNSSNNIIPPGGSIRYGSSVKAVMPNYNGNPDNSFDISEYDPLSNDNAVGSPFTGSYSSPDFIYTWTPSLTDISNMQDLFGADDGPYQWFFKINNKNSPYLNIRFCGDSIPDSADGETCDDGSNNGVQEDPIYDLSNGRICSAGQLPTGCQETIIPYPRCGDANVDILYGGDEECDCGKLSEGTNISTGSGCTQNNGQGNGQICIPDILTGQCQFCESSCTLKDYNGAELIWADTKGVPISQAEVGDTVLLVYPSASSTYGGGTFNVYEDDPLDDDSIIDIDNGILAGTNFDYVGSWKIKPEDVAKSPDDQDNYKFKIDDKTMLDINELEILTTSSDDPLTAKLTNIVCGDVLTLASGTYNMNIEYDVFDEDDLVSYVLKINDNAVAGDTDGTLDEFIFGGSFTYPVTLTATDSGTVNVRLEATNSRGDMVTDIVNLILIDPTITADYIAACIGSPANYEHIDSDYALFDATTSKALTYAPGSGAAYKNLDEMSFVWKFSDGSTNPYDSNDERAYLFEKYFPDKGGNGANLEIRVK